MSELNKYRKSNIWALTKGLDGKIYGGTGEGGTLFVYDPNNSISKKIGEVFDEAAVYSLATDEKGLIYGGTAWNSKLFVYYPQDKSITYLGQPVANGGIICSLAVLGSNIYGSTCDGGDSGYVGSHLFVHNSTIRSNIDLGQPVEGERSSKIILGPDGKIYGGTSPKGYLFSYDPGEKSFTTIGKPVQGEGTAFPLIAGKDGKIYFSLDGSLFVFDRVKSKIDRLFNLGGFTNTQEEFFWSLTVGLDGNIYGGTAPDGYLFTYNTTDNSVNVARPLESENRIRTLTTGHDGRLYGGTGPGAFLFSYNLYDKTSMGQARILSDDFNDNTINTSLWSAFLAGSGPTVAETNQRLEVDLPENSTDEITNGIFGTGYISTCQLRGDFDMQVDYNLLVWPPNNGVRVGLGAAHSPLVLVPVERISDEDELYLTHFDDGVEGKTITDDMSGSLRLIRNENTISGYYFRSGNWIPVHSGPSPAADINYSLAVWSHNSLFMNKDQGRE